ncbi:hypothetical protein HanIR_Chr10g0487931 [Helianthus annuus]|nr:hypothetical protein HanIR_Chr10g0487931 [Helianthus annuus]
MALRGKEETFVRRFAAGGNDGVPFNPRRYGDHSRRFAARGNEIVDHENFRESCDGYHPRRFAARGNEDPDLIYDSSPVFDEYEDDVWYAWATNGSYRCGFDEVVRLNENSLSPKIVGAETGPSMGLNGKSVNKERTECTKVPAAIFVDLFSGDEIIIGGGAVSSGGELQSMVSKGGDVPYLEVPIFQPPTKEILNFEVHKISSPANLGFQIDGDLAELNNGINIQIEENILVAIDKDNFGGSEVCMQDNGTRGPANSSSLPGKIKDVHVGGFGPKAKTRGRVFSKRGRMMQETRTYP